jgi:hypothetical protein
MPSSHAPDVDDIGNIDDDDEYHYGYSNLQGYHREAIFILSMIFSTCL